MAALEGTKRACFLKWKALMSVGEGRRRSEVEESQKVGRLVTILQSKLAANTDGAFGLLVQCNNEEKMQQKIIRSVLYLSAKTRARERQLAAMAYKALRVCSPALQQRAAKESLPLQRGACRLVSTLQLLQKKCLMNSMGAIKMAAVEEGLRREW